VTYFLLVHKALNLLGESDKLEGGSPFAVNGGRAYCQGSEVTQSYISSSHSYIYARMCAKANWIDPWRACEGNPLAKMAIHHL